jgi:receptor-type tyrosine-protein phosphatase R
MPLNHPTKLEIPGISNKNRYKGILPNEATRVKLPEPATTPSPTGSNNGSAAYTFLNPAATYINSNYMRGYDGEARAFIATQGPLPNTINDFWLMVFTERAPCIVMMTKLRERNRVSHKN